MNKRWLVTLGVIAALLLTVAASVAACSSPQATPASNTGNIGVSPGSVEGALLASRLAAGMSDQQVGIWVTGEGKVTAVPDIANLVLGVEAEARTVAEAQSQASAAMNDIMAALRGFNIADRDIRTQGFSIQPVWNYPERSQPVLVGFRVSNTVVVKVRNIADAGAIIDGVATAAGDLTRVQSIYFAVDDPKPLQQQAREDAVKDAMAKAQQMASVAGVTLGKPFYITESGGFVPFPVYSLDLKREAAGGMAMPAPPPISPGETEITVNVQMAFVID